MSVLKKGKNDLLTINPILAKEWHPTKNGNLKPSDVAVGSHKKVWWLGKCGHEWESDIHNRAKGIGCPICSGKLIVPGINDLASKYPQLAKEWHPTKNGNLKPSDVAVGSNKKVWWLNNNGIEWLDSIAHRVGGRNCPKKPGRKPIIGANDFQTLYPHLAKEWHPYKNEGISILSINAGSDKKYWWLCPKGHEYLCSPSHRSSGRGCPICNKERGTSLPEQIIFYYLNKYFKAINRYLTDNTEIDIYLPTKCIGIEYDGSHFHSSLIASKREDEKNIILKEKGIKLYRIKENEKIIDILIKDNCLFYNPKNDYKYLPELLKKLICLIDEDLSVDIDIHRDLSKIYEMYLSIEKKNSIAAKYPELISEWDFKKNGLLNPNYFSYKSGKKVWWKCSKGHSWQASISHRTEGKGCPVCTGRMIVPGENDLKTINPKLALEWHPTKNKMGPDKISPNSGKYAWWICPEGHVWKARIQSRNNGNGCPFCSGRILIKGKNDLLTLYPELAKEFDENLNGCKPSEVFAGGTRKYWWICSKCGNKWQANISNRIKGSGCHKCWRKTVGTILGKKVLNCETKEIFESATAAAKSLGSNSGSNISACCTGKKETFKGYHWKYVD